MVSDYLMLGFDHILDWNGYDHILFVAVLCALYKHEEWKKVLVLVTSFTLGHSLTLALSALNMVRIDAGIIETLIPITIILTGIFNIYTVMKSKRIDAQVTLNYVLALGFGLIHGLGFSNYFKAIMGKEDSILQPLFAFNLGVEIGQIIIVSLVMSLGYLVMKLIRVERKYWTITISSLAIVVATYLLFK